MKRKDRHETKQKTRCDKIEAKRCEKIEAKQSERTRKIHLLVSRNKAKRKRNGFCFASFRFDAKKNKKRKWDTLIVKPIYLQFLAEGWGRTIRKNGIGFYLCFVNKLQRKQHIFNSFWKVQEEQFVKCQYDPITVLLMYFCETTVVLMVKPISKFLSGIGSYHCFVNVFLQN